MDGQRESGAPDAAKPLLDGWLTRAEVAKELGLSTDTLARWATRREGPPCVRIGRKILYRAEAFREWLLEREPAPLTNGGAR